MCFVCLCPFLLKREDSIGVSWQLRAGQEWQAREEESDLAQLSNLHVLLSHSLGSLPSRLWVTNLGREAALPFFFRRACVVVGKAFEQLHALCSPSRGKRVERGGLSILRSKKSDPISGVTSKRRNRVQKWSLDFVRRSYDGRRGTRRA
jgi:hypothetical protein